MLCGTPGWASPIGKLVPETGMPFGNGGSGGLSGASNSASSPTIIGFPLTMGIGATSHELVPEEINVPRTSRFTVRGCPATGVTTRGGFSGIDADSWLAATGPPVAVATTFVPAASLAKLTDPSASAALPTAPFASFAEVTEPLARFLALTAFLAQVLVLDRALADLLAA